MTLRIYNSLTRRVDDFSPLEPGHVRLYVCGMTVYDLCHLGHARSMVAFDVVQRWLKASGYRVTYVRNVTDIDDKIHLGHAARRVVGVVIMLGVNHHAVQNTLHLFGHLVEQQFQLTGLNEIGNVVVGVVALARGHNPFTDLDRHGRAMVLRRVDFWSFHGMRAFLDMARIVPAIDSIPGGGGKALKRAWRQ